MFEQKCRLQYRERSHKEMERAVHNPDLKNLVNDVAFLTDKAMRDDVVIYAGCNVGHWFPTVARWVDELFFITSFSSHFYCPWMSRMFPTVTFLVYDGNPIKLDKMEQNNLALPPNVRLKPSWFSESEAKRFAKTGIPQHVPREKILLIADSNNLDWDKETPGPIIRDLDKDLADQDAWMHVIKPR
jgi:hypothetical protein